MAASVQVCDATKALFLLKKPGTKTLKKSLKKGLQNCGKIGLLYSYETLAFT
jgi:hypothetical protein